ncbi:MAG: hypothetical protein IJM19_02010 [Ruminococcus sp.]|nr:hypothetical protein [Ruminococcus sp.]
MMLYDGTDRVYVTGLKNSGRKTLISSIIHEFAFNAVWSDGNQWELSAMGKDAEMLEDAELIEKKMTSLEKIKVFDLEKVASDSNYKVPDFADLGLWINNEICGRIHFSNITGKQDGGKILTQYMFSVILVVIDCNMIVNNDSEYIDTIYEKMTKALNLCQDKPRVVFALTKADILTDEMKKNNFAEFYALFEKNCGKLVSHCMKNALIYRKRAVSALNESTSEIFGSDGNLLEEPNFKPWETDNLLVDIVSLATPLTRMKLCDIIERCNDVIRRRRSVFNSESIRAKIILRTARKHLCTTVKNIYPLDNAMKYLEKI